MTSEILTTEKRITAFALLGEAMRDAAAGRRNAHAGRLAAITENYHNINPWFTPENVRMALSATGEKLTPGNLQEWLSRYPGIGNPTPPLNVGIIMAGNIPLVGFHDLLCVLITGNRAIVKPASKDEKLIVAVTEILTSIEPRMREMIEITTGTLRGFDRVIATGSDNTSRYFDYYFRNYSSVIRHNRNSIAILDGNETEEELTLLGEDVFQYFGLGCRNVSKLYLPLNYDPSALVPYWSHYSILRSHNKYAVNYDHHKAVMIVNKKKFTDAGFILMQEEESLSPPMAVLNYEYYNDIEALKKELGNKKNAIQCIAGHGFIPFGNTQHPELWDYADNIDTVLFLSKKNHYM